MEKTEIKLLPKRLRGYRSKIFKDAWNDYKAYLDMQDLAQIFKVGLSQFYKIISRKKK